MNLQSIDWNTIMEFLHSDPLRVDTIHNTARRFVAAVEDGTGATAHFHADNLTNVSGYMVGGAVPEITIPAIEFDGRLAFYGIVELIRTLESADKLTDALGVWVEDGTVYMDASNVINNLDRALSLARKRGELSIYERATGNIIYTSTGTTEPAYT